MLQICNDPVESLSKERSLCVHLRPIFEYLRNEGGFKKPLFRSASCDKGDGWMNFLNGRKYDMNILGTVFDLPAFIHVNIEQRMVGCSRCWCGIQLNER